MELLIIQPSYYPANQSSGPNLSLHLLARALVKKGVDVTVYTTNYDVSIEPDICNVLDGVKIWFFSTKGLNHFIQFSPKFYKMIRKEIGGFDWVYITPLWNPFLWYPIRLSAKKEITFILSPRGSIYPELVEKKNSTLKKIVFRFLLPYLSKASYFHYTSQDEKEKVERYWNVAFNPIVIPNPIELDFFKSLPSKGSFKKRFGVPGQYLLHLGRIHWKKGLDIMAESFKRLLQDFPDLRWVIAGRDDGYRKTLEKQLSSLGCENKVHFVGLLQGQDKLEAFVDADAFALPSYSENFAVAAAEAMACGTPTLISDKVGIYREVKEYDAGLVVQPAADEVYRGLKRILEDAELRKTLSQNGPKLVRECFDAEKVPEEFIKAFNFLT